MTITPETVREVLAAAADVVFADGVPPEFLDQWAADTYFLLRVRDEAQGSSGFTNR
jgi:hypothetical protein